MDSPIVAYLLHTYKMEHLPSTSHTWPPAGLGMHLHFAYHRMRNPVCMHACAWCAGSFRRSVCHSCAAPSQSCSNLLQDKNQHHESTTDPKPHPQPSYGSSVQGCRSCRAPPDAMCRCHGEGVVAWLRRSGCMIFEVYPFDWSTVGLSKRRSDRPAQRPLCKAQVYGPGIRR